MKNLKFRTKCPDCKKRKYLINHHFIPKNLVKYLIEICGFDRGDIITLRNQLTIKICKDCERKFHIGEFYDKEKGKS
jgi:NMD protein affecting ribosome stability and mRNA decay